MSFPGVPEVLKLLPYNYGINETGVNQMTKANDAAFAQILAEAHRDAAAAVSVASIHFDEMAGACGFAWVMVSGNEPFARYCRKELKKLPIDGTRTRDRMAYGDKGYPSGWQFLEPRQP